MENKIVEPPKNVSETNGSFGQMLGVLIQIIALMLALYWYDYKLVLILWLLNWGNNQEQLAILKK